MNIKCLFLSLIYLTYVGFVHSESIDLPQEDKSFTYCFKEDQKPDTSNWFLFTTTIQNLDGQSETFQVLFPKEPEVAEMLGVRTYKAEDAEGMEYVLTWMPIPSADFVLRERVDFLVEALENSQTKKFLGMSCPVEETEDTRYGVSWTEREKQIYILLIKTKHFVYFLQTASARKEYLNSSSIAIESKDFDPIAKDALKTAAFTHSLAFKEEK